jgi:DNA end-binding protein Ku
MRPIWSGAISFGIVNIPVKLYPAVRDRGIHFHQISESHRKRIRYKKVAEGSDQEVPADDIVKGYEMGKGHYVLLDEGELQKLAARKSRAIDIIDFVDLEQIDPLFFDQPYYVAPDEKAGRSYWLLVRALEDSGKVAVAQFVMRSKEYLVAIRPANGVLCLETMRYADEIVEPDDAVEIPEEPVSERELKIARQLVESMSRDFDAERYRDEYRDRVLGFIEKKAKAKGGEVLIDEEWGKPEKQSGQVLDLMAALEESLRSTKRKPARGGGKRDGHHAAHHAPHHHGRKHAG